MSMRTRRPRRPAQWKDRCHCACGCNRRSKYVGQCTYCAAGAHSLSASDAAAVAYDNEERARRERTACTVCGKPMNWYELEPGTGRCPDCMP